MGGRRFCPPHNFLNFRAHRSLKNRRVPLWHKPKIRGGAFPARGVWGAKRPHKIRSTAFRGGAAEKT